MNPVWAILVALGLIATLTFVVMYAIQAPDWHRSSIGRTLMAESAVLSGLLVLSLLRSILKADMPDWVWMSGMASLDLVLWVQVLQLWRINRKA